MLSHALLPPFLLDSWDISCPHAVAPLISLSSLRLENIVSFWRAFSPNRVSFHNSAAYKGGKVISSHARITLTLSQASAG